MIPIKRAGLKWEGAVPPKFIPVLVFMEVVLMSMVMVTFFLVYMFAPKIICWNCRGISNRDTSNRILKFLRQDKPSVLCLVETRADSSRVDRLISKLSRLWRWAAILANGYSGGIMVIWNSRLGLVSPIAISRRALHLIISYDQSHSWLISVIYNGTRLSSQTDLWFELSKLSTLDFPWLIIGDFYSIISSNDHKGGSYRHYSCKAALFSDFISSNRLLDLHYIGSNFTWCNNRSGAARRWARLDRCLVNLVWYSMFNSYSLTYLPRLFSDHAPLLLTVNNRNARRFFTFRFNNIWFDYLGCHDAIRKAFDCTPHGNALHAFSHFLSRARANIKSWCKVGFNDIDSELISTEMAIRVAEHQDLTSIGNYSQLSNLYAKYSALQDRIPSSGPIATTCFGSVMEIEIPDSFITQPVSVSISPLSLKSQILVVILMLIKILLVLPL